MAHPLDVMAVRIPDKAGVVGGVDVGQHARSAVVGAAGGQGGGGASSWVREAQLKATWRRGVDGPPVLSQTLRRSAAVPRPHGVPSTWTA